MPSTYNLDTAAACCHNNISLEDICRIPVTYKGRFGFRIIARVTGR